MNYKKYKPYPTMSFKNRTWPDQVITKAPIWCSVDLRDGNQALPVPMGIEQKIEFYQLLQKIGFKQIEIGFPSASDTEFAFLRRLIEGQYIQEDVQVQVLVQARQHLIEKTFEALKGAKRAIVHFYNSTNEQQRRIVFKMSKEEIISIAREGARLCIEEAAKYPETDFQFEYSPESFTGTELDYALEICEAVMEVIQPTPEKPLILNLPATVEMSTPNVFADQIEWFSTHVKNRDCVWISVHTHNDRGTSVAASELGIMAGADRVEGTLFGNGERTGNVDLMTMGLNMFSRGVDPQLNLYEMDEMVEVYERCTGLTVHARHPYAGELVYAAFSGSHQDAIRKGFLYQEEMHSEQWDVPYLPIDPMDVGRKYEAIIRINSQSGKGGIAYILESEFGYKLPKDLHPMISKFVQKVTDETGKELSPQQIHAIFKEKFVNITAPVELQQFTSEVIDFDAKKLKVKAKINHLGQEVIFESEGNGPISAFMHGLNNRLNSQLSLVSYEEHSLDKGENAEAVAYIKMTNGSKITYGVGTDSNIELASIRAIISAVNQLI